MNPRRPRASLCASALACALLLVCASGAAAADPGPAQYVPRELVVRYVGRELPVEIRLPAGVGVHDAARALRANPAVAYAVPNYIARAAFVPDDPGEAGAPGGWQQLQWNFGDGPAGVGASRAWDHLIAAGRPGGAGLKVAVVDTGVAYEDRGESRRSPDFSADQFTEAKYDFVDDDPYPLDRSSHGTAVAGTIAESTDNGQYLTGLAYGVKLMPIRVLDQPTGTATNVAKGIRYAADHGADVINLSMQFTAAIGDEEVPQITEAINHANEQGVVVVAAAGNQASGAVSFPARAEHVIAVGAVAAGGCLTDYSNYGTGLDLMAPGGGASGLIPDALCFLTKPNPGTLVSQVTFSPPNYGAFDIVGLKGTSMAAPHVAAAAALVIASGVLGPSPTPEQVEQRLEATARQLGRAEFYGAGLLDAGAATAP